MSNIKLTADDFFLCFMDYKLRIFEWDSFRTRDFMEKLRMNNAWHGYAYFHEHQLAVATLKSRETVLQFVHMVPDKHRNFTQINSGIKLNSGFQNKFGKFAYLQKLQSNCNFGLAPGTLLKTAQVLSD